jgi:uncharacterized membrane protein
MRPGAGSPVERVFAGVALGLAVAVIVGLVALWPRGGTGAELTEGLSSDTERAKVTGITQFACPGLEGTECSRVRIELESGPDQGRETTIRLGGSPLDPELDVGDELRVAKAVFPPGASPAGAPQYSIVDFERRAPMLWLAIAFAAIVIAFGRLRGALALAGLALSLVVVLAFIVPAILRGESPFAVALIGSLAVMFATVPLAHGLGPKSMAAISGTSASLVLVALLALLFTNLTHLTGLSSEEAALLTVNGANISLEGLLVAGMLIGALGVLDDVTVSQASTVLALRAANPRLRFGELYRRAISVGRDHVSATVNTLVLAYVGSALPVLLIFGSGEVGALDAVNLELIAKEVVATLVGSIGLIAAVPITTAFAALLAERLPASSLATEAGHAH